MTKRTMAAAGILLAALSQAAAAEPAIGEAMRPAELLRAAEAGDAAAQVAAARAILADRLPPTAGRFLSDPARATELAVKFLQSAAGKGNAQAQYVLGNLHLVGRGVAEDAERARDLLRQAAEAGDAEAQNAVGQLYRQGRAVPRDDRAAIAWFEASMMQGHLPAMANLGYMHAQGLGVPRDGEKALLLTRRAAEGGVPEAQHNLAWMFESGTAVALSVLDALAWYRRAAEAGHAPAQLKAGLLLVRGKGAGERGEQLVEGVKWIAVAATGASPTTQQAAQSALEQLVKQLPTTVMLDGREAAELWIFRRGIRGGTAAAN